MKFFFVAASFLGWSGSVFACSLNLAPGVHTEISVPCRESQPDVSLPVAVNQATQNGGECRVSLRQPER
jgi:hypothetical protein